MDQRHNKLIEDGDRLFSKRQDLVSLWQEVALNFYPEMADFTITRSLGDEFADHLTTSYPIMARRGLGDALSALLRPVNMDTSSPGVWFSMGVHSDVEPGTNGKRWLEWATKRQREFMYHKPARFVRATKEGDHAFVTFGQAPLTVEVNPDRTGLLYRCHHLRDVAWSEGYDGEIDHVQRKWKPTATQLAKVFGKKVSREVTEKLSKDPYHTVECRHIMIARENYETRDKDGKKFRTPWVSVWIDVKNKHVMEEVGSWTKMYVIPRWVTIPASQYASSPAVMAALPDARLIQSMSLTLLEAGEKFADPPMVATQESIRGDVQLFAGGMTWVDAEYDERLGEALRPAYDVRGGTGLNSAFELRQDTREMIAKAFFLDSLSLPPPPQGDQMTAFEVGQRVSEWIRRAMPIFEPMEFEYNGALCEETFELLMRNGAFGPINMVPDEIRGMDVKFKFESPLHEGSERKKGQRFQEAQAMLLNASQLDPSVIQLMDARIALRDALDGMGVPQEWTRSEEEIMEIVQAQAEAQEQAALMGQLASGAETAETISNTVKNFADAGGQGMGV
jgi:hypothetical protein